MSDDQQTPQPQNVDPRDIGCRIVDVHSALQKAFTEFAQSEDVTLEGLAAKIHETLSDIPAFLIGKPAQ